MQESIVRSIARAENGSVVFLEPKQSDVVVPIIVRRLEEESILVGMSNLPTTRPLAHDLFVSLLKKRSFVLRQVDIHDYKDELFYARLVLQVSKLRIHRMDARPSDAIAIAVRMGVPIFIADKVIRDTAIPTSVMRREANSARVGMEIHHNEVKVDKLEYALQKAVEVENYEEAARIRDRIQKLQ